MDSEYFHIDDPPFFRMGRVSPRPFQMGLNFISNPHLFPLMPHRRALLQGFRDPNPEIFERTFTHFYIRGEIAAFMVELVENLFENMNLLNFDYIYFGIV